MRENAASVDIAAALDFLRGAEALKSTLRSGFTAAGRQESTAEHSWRLMLMAVTFAPMFPEVEPLHLLKMLLIHDLGEAVTGDVPATEQWRHPDKARLERAAFEALLAPLDPLRQREFLALYDEYEAADTPTARIAKGLDKIETILQHTQGSNPPDFDIGFNLGYGRLYTDADERLAAIRAPLDDETRLLSIKPS